MKEIVPALLNASDLMFFRLRSALHEDRGERAASIDRVQGHILALTAERDAMGAVVETAERWRDHMYPGRTATSDGVRICDSSIVAAVDAYRASKANQ